MDTTRAIKQLDQDDIYTCCINLDPDADEYVQDNFGNQYTVIDHVEKLPQLFMVLTKWPTRRESTPGVNLKVFGKKPDNETVNQNPAEKRISMIWV